MPLSPARSWAEAQAEQFRLPPAATDLLEELYEPSLPGAVADFDRELAALPGNIDLTWGSWERPPVTGLDHLLHGWSYKTLRRVLVWSRATMPPDARTVDSVPARPRSVCWRHWHVHEHIVHSTRFRHAWEERILVWDARTLPLMIRTLALGWSPPELPMTAWMVSPPPAREAAADAVRETAALLEDRLRSGEGTHRDTERSHRFLLEAASEPGDPRP